MEMQEIMRLLSQCFESTFFPAVSASPSLEYMPSANGGGADGNCSGITIPEVAKLFNVGERGVRHAQRGPAKENR